MKSELAEAMANQIRCGGKDYPSLEAVAAEWLESGTLGPEALVSLTRLLSDARRSGQEESDRFWQWQVETLRKLESLSNNITTASIEARRVLSSCTVHDTDYVGTPISYPCPFQSKRAAPDPCRACYNRGVVYSQDPNDILGSDEPNLCPDCTSRADQEYMDALRKRVDDMRGAWEHGVLVRADLQRQLERAQAKIRELEAKT